MRVTGAKEGANVIRRFRFQGLRLAVIYTRYGQKSNWTCNIVQDGRMAERWPIAAYLNSAEFESESVTAPKTPKMAERALVRAILRDRTLQPFLDHHKENQ